MSHNFCWNGSLFGKFLAFLLTKRNFQKKKFCNWDQWRYQVQKFANLFPVVFFIFKTFVCCYFSFIPFSKKELNFDIWTIENSAFYRLWISIPRSHKKITFWPINTSLGALCYIPQNILQNTPKKSSPIDPILLSELSTKDKKIVM